MARERVARLFVVHADKRTPVDSACAGDIVAAAGLKEATTGDTLCAQSAPILLERIDANVPVLSQAIEVASTEARARLNHALAKLAEEDPTFRVREDAETGQTIIAGMGELHLDVIVDRIRREYGVQATLGRPQVVCRETVRAEAEGHAVFERELKDKAIYGDVACVVRPRARGAGLLVRSSLPALPAADVTAAALQGLRDAASSGTDGHPLDDCELTLTRVVIRDGQSGDIGARAAAAEACRRAVAAAQPALLEPIMRVEVAVDEPHLGPILGDLQQRRGRIQEVADRPGRRVVTALVPLRGMFGYATRMRSLSEGHATFNMQFDSYDAPEP
jgi:elongation factor G